MSELIKDRMEATRKLCWKGEGGHDWVEANLRSSGDPKWEASAHLVGDSSQGRVPHDHALRYWYREDIAADAAKLQNLLAMWDEGEAYVKEQAVQQDLERRGSFQ